MTTDRQQYIDLAERCEAAEAGSRELDAEIAVAFNNEPTARIVFTKGKRTYRQAGDGRVATAVAFGKGCKPGMWLQAIRYTTSLDAAMTLLPEGCFWSITMRGERRGGYHACCQLSGDLDWREAKTPALALLAAICRAMGEG